MLFRAILSIMSQELQWSVVVTLEDNRKGKEEQFETVVPFKWLSRDEKWLWWPPSLQVKSKVHCDPDVTTRKKFKVLKAKIIGMKTHFVKAWCADGLNPPSIDNSNIYRQAPFYLFSKSLLRKTLISNTRLRFDSKQ